MLKTTMQVKGNIYDGYEMTGLFLIRIILSVLFFRALWSGFEKQNLNFSSHS